MTENSDEYYRESPPMLSSDGVTILVMFGGRTAEGQFYDGCRKVRPGDPQYDELLPNARKNPQREEPEPSDTDPSDFDTLLKWFEWSGEEGAEE